MSNDHIRMALVGASEHWAAHFKDCFRFWTSATRTPDFWAAAARISERHDIPPDLLIPLVHNHLNDGSRDVTVQFHCNVMKAESLMERAVFNCRIYLREQLRDLQDVSMATGIPGRESDSTIGTIRTVAELVLENYRIGLKVLFQTVAPGKDPSVLPPALRDSIAYRACERNPFLLCDRAELPLTRHLGYNSIRALLKYQPWVRHIWDGLIRTGHALTNETEIAGTRCDPYPFMGPNWSWPPDPSMTYPVQPEPPHPDLMLPRMYINRPLFHAQVTSYIAAKAEVVRQKNPHLGR